MSTESSSIASDAPPTPARARPLLASIAAKDPRSAAKKELKKPGSFALGSPVKPPSGSSGSGGNEILSQLLASMARSASVDEEGDDLRELMPAVVKVFTTHTVPNYSLPWQMRRSMWVEVTDYITARFGRSPDGH